MRDVSFKFTTRREATAIAELTAAPETLAAVREGRVPKGDALTVAKVAAVMAAKRTTDWIPYCHPIPIEFVDVRFELKSDRIVVEVDVVSVAKTGVEMEAMTAASAAVLNLYDMLKMLDDDMEIVGVRLLSKKGGKSDFARATTWRGAVLVVSDRAATGVYDDLSGEVLREGMLAHGANGIEKQVVTDDIDAIQAAVKEIAGGVDLLLVTGGTGISPRDVTPEAVLPLLDREMPGVVEALRRYGQDRIPQAMFSRSVAGVFGSTIVVTLPGAPSACRDALRTLFPALLHAKEMLSGGGHA